MKRDHLNESFHDLASSLELSDQNNGKASVLNEATRTMENMLAQIEHLRKENASLLTESHYVTVEKSELKDENSALEAEIDQLRAEMNLKVSKFQLDLNMTPPESHNQEHGQFLSPSHVASNIQAYLEAGAEQLACKHVCIVSKPHARYLTPDDKWLPQVVLRLGKGAIDTQLLIFGRNEDLVIDAHR